MEGGMWTDLLGDWLDAVAGPEWQWYAKRLSGNDTLATGSHQAGPYMPKNTVFSVFPSLLARDEDNPRTELKVQIRSDDIGLAGFTVTAIWYNNKQRGGSRDETRITGWGGAASPLLDPEATGSLVVFAFRQADRAKDADLCEVWICSSVEEEQLLEQLLGPVEPAQAVSRLAGSLDLIAKPLTKRNCRLSPEELPREWKDGYPDGAALVAEAVRRRSDLLSKTPDRRLMARRECEFDLFQSIEDFHELPKVRKGFEGLGSFLDLAHSVTNRRKSRTGRSLELHARQVFREEGLSPAHDKVSELKKRPDFIFPSIEAYHDESFPEDQLIMLAVKTTCKDRWRQVLTEATRVRNKHLLTIQAGVSEAQFAEMKSEGVTLVVPEELHSQYPLSVRDDLMTLAGFVKHCHRLYS